MEQIILETRELTKSYHNQPAADHLSLVVPKNSVYGLLGPNGAGKSTFLKMLTGMLIPDSGKIIFEGHVWSRADLRNIGALIEVPPVYSNLTAWENLKVRTLVLGLPVLAAGLFVWYAAYVDADPSGAVSGYMQMIAFAYPAVTGILCAYLAEQEGEGGYQTLLMMPLKKSRGLAGKWAALSLAGLGAVILAAAGFAALYEWVLGKQIYPFWVYLLGGLMIWGCQLCVYLLHLFISFRLSPGVSIRTGIAESLIAGLFLAGLGEGIWTFFPCAWGERWITYLLLYVSKKFSGGIAFTQGEAVKNAGICLAVFFGITFAVFLWYRRFEGRVKDD